MMTTELPAEPLRPLEALEALVARHGLMKVILTLPVVALRRGRDRTVRAHELPPHILRDIGLGADGGRGKSWELG